MRVVIFTSDPNLAAKPWWNVLLETSGIEAVLVCLQVSSNRLPHVLRRFRRNVKKHGPIFIPYRFGLLAIQLLRWPFSSRDNPRTPITGLPVDQLNTTDLHSEDTLEQVRSWKPDLGISLGAPILKPALFRIPRRGTINMHLGQVPEFRGAPPGFWELYAGANQVGATIHWMDEGLDTGRVLAEGRAPIYQKDLLAEVEARAAELGVILLRRTLAALVKGEVDSTPQPGGGRIWRMPTLHQRAALALRLASRRMRRNLHARTLVRSLTDCAALLLLRPVRDLLRTLRGKHPVRIFTFHRITTLCRDGMTVSPATFHRQIEYIRRHHDVVTIERARELIVTGARLRKPVAALTFDDGYKSVFEHARPAMMDEGLTGCCFICTDLAGTDRRLAHDDRNPVRQHLPLMTWEEITDLVQEGWSVGGHTATHPRLSTCAAETAKQELARPLDTLRQRFGLSSVSMAYPFGGQQDITPTIAKLIGDLGYVATFSDFGGENFPYQDPFELKRIEVGGDHRAMGWRASIHGIDLAHLGRLWKAPDMAGTRG